MPNMVFRRNTDIGAADAESDDFFLADCFVDTGDVDALTDCSNPKALILGRTGAGKTALIKQFLKKQKDNSVELSPEKLALNYVTNSNILQFFETAGVNLDIFYTLLWRHILTVELLRLRYDIRNEIKQQNFVAQILSRFTLDKGKQRAFQYLQEWGDKFWQETEYRTKEFTRKLETDLKAAAKIGMSHANLGAEGARKLTEEEKYEIREAGNRIVNEVQVRELHNVISILSEDVFNSEKNKYYIVIDRLDEGWVDDRIRFKLIKSLIEAIKTFHKVRNVKIMIALRIDILSRVLRETPSAGFQEEKYRSLYLHIRWTRSQLENLLAKRVAFLFKRKYTRDNVTLGDIIPNIQINKRTAITYMLDRTFSRPREAILFVNQCISLAEGSSKITAQIIRKAEVSYSQQRLHSLFDEWRREYPNLDAAVEILRASRTKVELRNLNTDACDKSAEELTKANRSDDALRRSAQRLYLDQSYERIDFLSEVIMILYQVGAVGIQLAPHSERSWSFEVTNLPLATKLKPESEVSIHKTFWSALGVIHREKGDDVD